MADSSNFSFTEGEVSALTKAMQKPEFRSLLNEYVDEISDPKNKEEFETYIKQLEQGGELPGRVVIRPDPEFCIKTQAKGDGRSYKVFINLCSSDKIRAPSNVREREGSNWDIPYAMNQGRHDQDNKGGTCFTYDSAFHPEAFQIAFVHAKFQQIMCDICVEAAGHWLQRNKETISPDYKVMKRLKCKGATPGSIIVSEKALNDPKPTSIPPPSGEKRYDLQTEGPKLYKEMLSQQVKDRQHAAFAAVPEAEEEDEGLTEEIDLTQPPQKVVVPEYKVVESSKVDFGDLIETRVKQPTRPESITVEIRVPYMVIPTQKQSSDGKIDINGQELIFDLQGIYYLQARLPYPVDSDAGKAKFDSKKKVLRIILPVIPLKKDPVELETRSAPVELEGKETDPEETKEEQKLETTSEAVLTAEEPVHLAPVPQTSAEELPAGEDQSPAILHIYKEPTTDAAATLPEAPSEDTESAPPIEVKYRAEADAPSSDQTPPPPSIEELPPTARVNQAKAEDSEPAKPTTDIPEPAFTFQEDTTPTAHILFCVPGLLTATVKYSLQRNGFTASWLSEAKSEARRSEFAFQFSACVAVKASSVQVLIDYVVLRLAKAENELWTTAGKFVSLLEPVLEPEEQHEDPPATESEIVKFEGETEENKEEKRVGMSFIAFETKLLYELV